MSAGVTGAPGESITAGNRIVARAAARTFGCEVSFDRDEAEHSPVDILACRDAPQDGGDALEDLFAERRIDIDRLSVV